MKLVLNILYHFNFVTGVIMLLLACVPSDTWLNCLLVGLYNLGLAWYIGQVLKRAPK